MAQQIWWSHVGDEWDFGNNDFTVEVSMPREVYGQGQDRIYAEDVVLVIGRHIKQAYPVISYGLTHEMIAQRFEREFPTLCNNNYVIVLTKNDVQGLIGSMISAMESHIEQLHNRIDWR